jgi:hypothetical protein
MKIFCFHLCIAILPRHAGGGSISSLPPPSSFASMNHPSSPYDLALVHTPCDSLDNSSFPEPFSKYKDNTTNVAPVLHPNKDVTDSQTTTLSYSSSNDWNKMPNSSVQKPAQQKLNKWLVHHPFIPGIPAHPSTSNINSPSNPRQVYINHLKPYGTPLNPIDSTRTLRLCMQNTQFSFQLYNDGVDISHILHNLPLLDINMFVQISPNVIWSNPSNWTRTK